MTALTYELKASYAFIERNFNIVKRYWTWEIVWLVYTVANSLAVSFIGLGFESMGGSGIQGRYFVLYLAVGTIEYTLMAPITRFFHMAGQTAFAIVYSLVHTGVVLVATVMLFDLSLANANLFGFVLMLVAGSLSFIGISVVGSILPLLFPERGSQMTHLIIAVLLLVSGVYYPIDVLPRGLQLLATFSPATYVIEGSRAALLNGAATGTLWPYLWPLLIMGVIAIPAGLRIFHWAEQYAKRAGKLHRNG
jgi:ABC-2 type transport system permease protein